MKEKSTIEAKQNNILTINGGSSSIKFALYQNDGSLHRLLHGKIDQIGLSDSKLLINHESGMLGISEISSDMRDLLKVESSDIRAAKAVELFCFQAKKWIGVFAAALGGIDTLVFAGGIGGNSPVIRSRICKGLEFLGIEIDEKRNRINDPLIATDSATVAVRIIHTDEEQMIAKTVRQLINISK